MGGGAKECSPMYTLYTLYLRIQSVSRIQLCFGIRSCKGSFSRKQMLWTIWTSFFLLSAGVDCIFGPGFSTRRFNTMCSFEGKIYAAPSVATTLLFLVRSYNLWTLSWGAPPSHQAWENQWMYMWIARMFSGPSLPDWGKVQCCFRWLTSESLSPWLHMATPHLATPHPGALEHT